MFAYISQPSGEFEVVPGSEMVLMREARRNETSTYYVDGKKYNFNDVASILRQRGIDLDHNRFLILQVSSSV
jgi:structural maintenance of chromosome 4